MIRRLGVNDFDFVHWVLSHESVYHSIKNDINPEKPDETLGAGLLDNKDVYVLSPNDNTVFIFMPHTEILYCAHTNVLPEGRGKDAIIGAKEASLWIFDNTPCVKIFGLTPAINRAALRFNVLAGYRKEGVLTKAHLKNGALIDYVMFGLSKEEAMKWEL